MNPELNVSKPIIRLSIIVLRTTLFASFDRERELCTVANVSPSNRLRLEAGTTTESAVSELKITTC